MTVSLDNGAVIVQAAKRTSGHLYVKTPDCRVAVTGTVFSVDSGIKGSRLAVLEGSVKVMHAGVETLVHAGDQMTTNDNLRPASAEQQIAWSHDRDKYLPLLAQFAILQHKIEQIPFPQSRFSSDLLQRVPAGTLLYVSIPNLGDFLSEANKIFHDQLQQSPELQQWWSHGQGHNTAELDAMVDKLHQMSQYIGDEVVIVGVKQTDHPGIAITVSSGDGGYGVEFPAASQYVTAVGGTTLTGSLQSGWNETAWSGAGSGCSAYIPKPSWQKDSGCANRTVADVAADADPNTGVAVYDSFRYQGYSGWLVFGGTSVASPIIASVYALAGNAASVIDGASPYAHTGSLHDITSGSNGSCGGSYLCTAGPGYDGPTGNGTPNGTGAF